MPALVVRAIAAVAALGLVFGAGYGIGRGAGRGRAHVERRITLDPSERTAMIAESARRAGRTLTPEEERGVIARWVDTEILNREALALGLDRGDIIVRRRLVQKMELRAEEAAGNIAPSDAEIARELETNAARYARPARVAFEHVFVGWKVGQPTADRRGAEERAAKIGAALARGADPAGLGDPFIRGRSMPPSDEKEIAGMFGEAFAARVMALQPGPTFVGPVESSYGLHLVRVTANEPARPATLDEARTEVARDLVEHRRAHARDVQLEQLRARYQLQLAAPNVHGGSK